jgi:hypothetical protein
MRATTTKEGGHAGREVGDGPAGIVERRWVSPLSSRSHLTTSQHRAGGNVCDLYASDGVDRVVADGGTGAGRSFDPHEHFHTEIRSI